jgi:D-ribose pyranase
VIADRGFPNWPALETVDISLSDDLPTVLDVLKVIRPNFVVGADWMAEEFQIENGEPTKSRYAEVLEGIPVSYEPHVRFKQRVPSAVRLIRTGDTTRYANIILESA